MDKTQQANEHYQRGIVLEQAGRIAEAVEEYRKAVAQNPQLRAAHVALAHYYRRHGLVAKSIDAWRDAVTIQPDYEALTQLATAQIELKRYGDARATLRQCLMLEPLDSFVLYELAFISYEEGDFRGALDQLLELRPVYNDEWQLHELLGQCQVKLGFYDAALASFGRAMLLTNDDEQLVELQHNVAMIERHQEFDMLVSLKDRWYAEHGMVVVGSSGDDGIVINEQTSMMWDYADLARTVQRLIQLKLATIHRCTSVLAFNRIVEPIAQVMAHLLNIPIVQSDQLKHGDHALLVLPMLDEEATITTIDDDLPCESVVMFALAMRFRPEIGDLVPQIVGVPARHAVLPWEAELSKLRQQPNSRPAIQALLDYASATLMRAIADLLAETNAQEQIAYYQKHKGGNRDQGSGIRG